MLGVFRRVVARDHPAQQQEAGAVKPRIPAMQREAYIAALAALSIVLYLLLRYGLVGFWWVCDAPLLIAIAVGGLPLILELARHVNKVDFGADLLAGASIVTAILMCEFLVGAIVVLMLSAAQPWNNMPRAALPRC
jgi:hypothetical protein